MATREWGKGAWHLTSRQAGCIRRGGGGHVLALIESHWAWISFICFLAGIHLSHSLDKLQTGRAAGEIFDWPVLPELSNFWQMIAETGQVQVVVPNQLLRPTGHLIRGVCGMWRVQSSLANAHKCDSCSCVCLCMCKWYSLTLTYAKQLHPENVTTLSLWSNPITEWNWNSLTLARPNSPLYK